MKRLVIFAPDLMDRSRFGPVSGDKMFVKSADELSGAIVDDVVVADLSRSGALEALTGLNGHRRVAFISHEDREVIATAKEQGIEVYPRSRFFSRIVEILSKDQAE